MPKVLLFWYSWPKLKKKKKINKFWCQSCKHINIFPQASSQNSESWWEFFFCFFFIHKLASQSEQRLTAYRNQTDILVKTADVILKKQLEKEIEGKIIYNCFCCKKAWLTFQVDFEGKIRQIFGILGTLWERKEKHRQNAIFKNVYLERENNNFAFIPSLCIPQSCFWGSFCFE